MSAMLRFSLSLIVIASFVTTAFGGGGSVGRQSPALSGNYYYPAQSYVAMQPQTESRRAYSYEPGQLPNVGDTAVIGKALSELKVGTQVIAGLPQGARITVAAVQGAWIGTVIDLNGQRFAGWVLASDLAVNSASASIPTPSR
jgi:hypothetical protein